MHFTNVIFEGDVSGIRAVTYGVVWFKGKPFDCIFGSYGGGLTKISCPKEHLIKWIDDISMDGIYGNDLSSEAIDLTEYDITDIDAIFSNRIEKLWGEGMVTYLKSSDKDYAENFIKEHGKPFSCHSRDYYDYGFVFYSYFGYGAEDVYINGKRDSFITWIFGLPYDDCEDNWGTGYDDYYKLYNITEKNVGAIFNIYEESKYRIYNNHWTDPDFSFQIPYERLLEEWEHYGNFGTFKKGVDKKEFYREIVELYERESKYDALHYLESPGVRCVYEEAKRRAGL